MLHEGLIAERYLLNPNRNPARATSGPGGGAIGVVVHGRHPGLRVSSEFIGVILSGAFAQANAESKDPYPIKNLPRRQ